jgi:PIN domain nuclease of toxin-antitoxin system
MIILDTHIWVWWVHGDEQITSIQAKVIKANETDIIGVSAISAWEIAKLVEYNRLELPCPLQEWFYDALSYPQASA